MKSMFEQMVDALNSVSATVIDITPPTRAEKIRMAIVNGLFRASYAVSFWLLSIVMAPLAGFISAMKDSFEDFKEEL